MAEFNCPLNKYCSDQQMTEVGTDKTKIYHRTVTTLTGTGPAYTGSKTETYILRKQPEGAPINSWQVVATTTDGGKTQTFTNAAGADLKKSLSPGGNLAKNTQIQTQQTLAKGLGRNSLGQNGTVLDKISPEKQKKLKIISPNVASSTGAGSTTVADAPVSGAKETVKENKEYREGTRKEYDLDMRYPINLSGFQDVIKFSILEYSPSLAKENQNKVEGQFGSTKSRVVTLSNGNPIIVGSKRIGGITLPIPAGISDSNPVGWERDEISQLQSELAKIAKGFFEDDGGEAVGKTVDNLDAANASGEASEAVKKFFLDEAVKNASASKRAFGAVFNNNIELLFSGANLRQFSFTFLFYPREEKEAIMVRKIIRAFKQSMSVKRSKNSLLLKAPHTFAIKYMTTNQKGELIQHPYLNRFKECALTSCNVDYTPENTYMTYVGDEKSMTAYRLALSFTELEPLFDDEYGTDDNIGF
jgi:hypothetical protein